MNRKTIRLIVIILAAALLVAALPFALSRIVYHRSLEATLFERQIRAGGHDAEPDAGRIWMARKAAISAGELTLPEGMQTAWTRETFSWDGGTMDWYQSGTDTARVIVYFHGGSFIDRPSEAHWLFVDRLAADTGAKVIVPLYPRLPDNTADDAYTALLAFCREVIEPLGSGKLIFMGDSAGGGMALALAELLATEGINGPEQLILISPWLDLSMDNDEMEEYADKDPKLDREALRYAGRCWAGEREVYDPLISPLYGDFSDIGSVALYAGTRELLYPDIVRFAALLDAAGHDYTLYTGSGMNHVWPLFQCYNLREAETATNDIEEKILQ